MFGIFLIPRRALLFSRVLAENVEGNKAPADCPYRENQDDDKAVEENITKARPTKRKSK